MTINETLEEKGIHKAVFLTVQVALEELDVAEIASLDNALTTGTFPCQDHIYYKTACDNGLVTDGMAHQSVIESLKIAVPIEISRRIKFQFSDCSIDYDFYANHLKFGGVGSFTYLDEPDQGEFKRDVSHITGKTIDALIDKKDCVGSKQNDCRTKGEIDMRFDDWVAECLSILGWQESRRAEFEPAWDLSWYFCYDDGMTPAAAVNKAIAAGIVAMVAN